MRDPHSHLQHVNVTYPRQLAEQITGAGRKLSAWLGRLAPEHRLQLGLQRPEPAPYLPHNRRRMARRRTHRRMVAASRRANR